MLRPSVRNTISAKNGANRAKINKKAKSVPMFEADALIPSSIRAVKIIDGMVKPHAKFL